MFLGFLSFSPERGTKYDKLELLKKALTLLIETNEISEVFDSSDIKKHFFIYTTQEGFFLQIGKNSYEIISATIYNNGALVISKEGEFFLSP